MSKVELTCVECPMGCTIEVETEHGRAVSVKGNTCPRGKLYAENEVVCPKRVITTTVRAVSGEMIPVKTSEPVNKAEMFEIMKKINGLHPVLPVKIGDILLENISDGANLVATGNRE
ncbi:MAG: DUF1667 domain-containing protein [Clostridiales bacterium]|nr:DUF1667 domain-containing protein [Clostridiales bacterium]